MQAPTDSLLVLVPLAGMATGVFFLVTIGRLVGRWMDQRHERELARGQGRELEEIRARLDAVEQVVGRVQELEERLDFAERVLTRQRRDLLSGDAGPVE